MRKSILLGICFMLLMFNPLNVNAAPIPEVPKIQTTEDIAEDKINHYLLDMINELRISYNLETLSVSEDLESFADIRAEEASILWSHTRPDGTQGLDLISKNLWAGENLSYIGLMHYNYSDDQCRQIAEQVFASLCASQSHLDNMICPNFKYIGINTYTTYEESGKSKIYTAYMFSS